TQEQTSEELKRLLNNFKPKKEEFIQEPQFKPSEKGGTLPKHLIKEDNKMNNSQLSHSQAKGKYLGVVLTKPEEKIKCSVVNHDEYPKTEITTRKKLQEFYIYRAFGCWGVQGTSLKDLLGGCKGYNPITDKTCDLCLKECEDLKKAEELGKNTTKNSNDDINKSVKDQPGKFCNSCLTECISELEKKGAENSIDCQEQEYHEYPFLKEYYKLITKIKEPMREVEIDEKSFEAYHLRVIEERLNDILKRGGTKQFVEDSTFMESKRTLCFENNNKEYVVYSCGVCLGSEELLDELVDRIKAGEIKLSAQYLYDTEEYKIRF
ncbi:7895_t:CDS:2, partial [Racocetra persica]